MRLTYANVASTLALVLALGGTGAYAAGKVTGKSIKNSSVTGKDIRDGSLAGPDVAAGSLGADRLAPGVQAALLPKPEHATEFDVTVPATAETATHQPGGTVAGLTLDVQCWSLSNGQTQFHSVLNGTLADATAYLDGQVYRGGAAPEEEYAKRTTSGSGLIELAQTVNLASPTAVGVSTFTLHHASGVRFGTVYSESNNATDTCRFTGWITRP